MPKNNWGGKYIGNFLFTNKQVHQFDLLVNKFFL